MNNNFENKPTFFEQLKKNDQNRSFTLTNDRQTKRKKPNSV